MKKQNNTYSGGLGIGEVLALIFIVLKLIGVIKWSWIWVLSPLWISFGLVVLLFLLAFICSLFM